MKKRLLIPLLFAASHAVSAADGQVTFTGTIYDDACQSANTQQPSLNCARDGVVRTLPLRLTHQPQALPYRLGNVSATPQRSVNIVTVNYH